MSNMEGGADLSFFSSFLEAFPAFQQKKNVSSNSGSRDFKRTQVNGRTVSTPTQSFLGSYRDSYWNRNGTGPRLESKKFAGTTYDLPVVAPLSAKTEDKKLILMQTLKRIEHAKGTGADWASKTDFMVNRFIGAVPHVSNEADSQLQKFDSLSTNLFELGRP